MRVSELLRHKHTVEQHGVRVEIPTHSLTHTVTHSLICAFHVVSPQDLWLCVLPRWQSRVVDGGVTATGVLSRERGNLITISITLY